MTDDNSLYKKLIEEIQEYAIIVLDKNGIIQNWNQGAYKIKMYTEEEIIGRHFSIFYLPEDIAAGLPQGLLAEAAGKGRATHEGWRKRKDGSVFWGSIVITAMHNDDGEIIGFSKVTRDLTDKKSAEDRLRMSEERYHKMIAEVQDYAIILLNIDGVIENWNAGAEKIKGYTADEIVGKKFELFYTPADREVGLPGKLLKIAADKGKATHQGWRVRKDGTMFWGTIVITALHNNEGDIIGYSKVTRDLTHQKIAEDKLAAYTAELEKQNRELEQYAYVASHDLQEPLRKIRTFADLIRENIDDKEFVNRYFEKLSSSAARMAEMVKSLLNYSRLSKDKPADTTVNLHDVLEEVKQDFELLIEEKGAAIFIKNLPQVKGNHIQLVQLFSNLVGNSLKFSKEHPVIKIEAAIIDKLPTDAPVVLQGKKYYHISVADNGIGFEEEYSKIIFSLFQRLHGKHDYAGTGIGLALCRKIVENHNGFINAESAPGKGANFNIYLPVE